MSAIGYPASWLFVAGLTTPLSRELQLVFATLGAYLLALGIGAGISAIAPTKHPGIIMTLIIGNILDFGVTLKAIVAQQLGILNGAMFLVITIAWAVLLSMAYINVKRSAPES